MVKLRNQQFCVVQFLHKSNVFQTHVVKKVAHLSMYSGK